MGSVDFRFEPLSPQHSRIIALTSLMLFGLIALIYEYHDLGAQTAHSILPALKNPSYLWTSSSPSSDFWPTFSPLLAAAAPRCQKPKLSGNAVASIRGTRQVADVENHIEMEKEDVDSMRRSHSWFVDQITQQPPTLQYKEGTQGIVTSAGGAYFPPLLVSLRFLRRTGSTLPVEVFLATPEEYEPLICDTILPSLNAKCIILSTLVDQYLLPFSFTKYQLKAFAMLFSSFESLLFLDADNFPLFPPEDLFASEPFTSHHLILWPDYWTPTPSPLFSTIAGLKPDTLTTRPTIEAGQILISKEHHAKTLLLAAYYNAYSEYYYHLMSQGGPGEGDKETFSAAALALGAPFYTVSAPPRPLGARADGAAVLQSSPITDYNHTTTKSPSPFFIHASWPPKLNAYHNVRDRRQWGKKEDSLELFGEDLEPVAWGFMVEMACEKGLEFKDWNEGKKAETEVCEKTRESFRKMFRFEFKSE